MNLFSKFFFPFFLWFWFYPIVFIEVIFIICNWKNPSFSWLYYAQLGLASLFSYLYFNLRRDRLDMEKHYEILNYVKHYEDCHFSIKQPNAYINEQQFESFRNTYFDTATTLTNLLSNKINRFLNKKIKIIFIMPNSANEKRKIPDGLKAFPSYITHQTVIFTTDDPNKLNPFKRFAINHELGHMHPHAMLPMLLHEIHVLPFIWFVIYCIPTITWSLYAILILGIIALLVFLCDAYYATKTFALAIKLKAEMAADFMGLRLLSPEERQHPVFRAIKFIDPGLDEANNQARMKFFHGLLDRFEKEGNFKFPNLASFPFPVFLLIIPCLCILQFKTVPTIISLKFLFGFCCVVQLERFINHQKILKIKRHIETITNCQIV